MRAQGDTYEVALHQTYEGQTILNVYHVTLTGAITDATAAQADFSALATAFKDIARSQQVSGLAYQSWTAKQVAGAGVTYDTTTCKPSGGDQYTAAFTTNPNGGTTGQPVPAAFEACVVSLRGVAAGRSHRGRVFYAGINLGNAPDPDHFGGAAITALNNALATALSTTIPAAGPFEWTVFSRVIASGCRSVPTVVNGKVRHVLTHVQAASATDCFTPVVTATASNLIAPMHRRKIGVGS